MKYIAIMSLIVSITAASSLHANSNQNEVEVIGSSTVKKETVTAFEKGLVNSCYRTHQAGSLLKVLKCRSNTEKTVQTNQNHTDKKSVQSVASKGR